MALTALQIAQLNKMNRAAQNAALGTLLASLEDGGLPGTTPGTVEINKAVVAGPTKNIDTIVIADGGLYLGAGAGTSVTSTAAELNILDGVTSSAAELNILDGVTKTAAGINGLVEGVAGGYKIARGVATIGTASDTVVTGLATVVGVVVSLVGDPSLTHMWSTATVGNQSGAPAAGSIIIKSWKPTATGDVTPIAADTVFANVAWIAIGT